MSSNDREPLRVLSFGAGVQSSTLALMASMGEIEPPDCAIFADTQDEPQSVYRWLDWITPRMSFPLHVVSCGRLSESALKMRTSKKSGLKFCQTNIPFFTLGADGSHGKIHHRSCTADYKILPIIRKNRDLVGRERMNRWRNEHRAAIRAVRSAWKAKKTPPRDAWRECQDHALVEQWIGISTDEVRRVKPSRDPWVRHRWPLIERRISRSACVLWFEKHGLPEPPRSACRYCPYHHNSEWRRLKEQEPEEFAMAVEFERQLQAAKSNSDIVGATPFLHVSRKPLDQVDFTEGGQLRLWEDECFGMCGV